MIDSSDDEGTEVAGPALRVEEALAVQYSIQPPGAQGQGAGIHVLLVPWFAPRAVVAFSAVAATAEPMKDLLDHYIQAVTGIQIAARPPVNLRPVQ